MKPPLPHHRALPRACLVAGWLLLAALPILYILGHIVATSRNIVFWDEFDTALDLILHLDAGAGWREILGRLFAITNEHRTVMSRLLFATSYWLTGTVNFHVIGAIGNLFFFALCTILVFAVQGWERRVRMTVVLAFMMFQLEHFESFIWSGASIDHFQVVMLAVLAIAALARGTTLAMAGGTVCAVLATFTLAQGNAVWVVGAAMLAHGRRWKEFAAWLAIGIVAVAAFLRGFEFNPGHAIAAPTGENLVQVVHYWLQLLGAPLTLGDARRAPLPGIALLVVLGVFIAQGLPRRQPVAWFSALFAVGALALIALGRAELANGTINSRYFVLGALAWALVIFMLLDVCAEVNPARPFRHLAWLLPGLIAFNVGAAVKFSPMIDSFVEVRDRAATAFEQHGADGHGVASFRLHPRDKHAEVLMRRAEERGVYRLPEFSRPAQFADAKPNTRIIAHLDEIIVNERALTIGGWAMLPERRSRRGEIHVVLRSADSQRVFTAVPLPRPDIVAAYKESRWRYSGFRAVIRRERLPNEDFQLGVLIANGGEPQFLMTANRLELSGPEPKVLRPPPIAKTR